jgi:putative ABC transport system permease protein
MILTDIRIALRSLGRRPGFVLVAVATLALAIGANTAIFGIVNAVILQPLPFDRPDRLVVLMGQQTTEGRQDDVSALDLIDFRENRSLTALSAWRQWGFALTGHGEPQDLSVVRVSADLFTTLGVSPARGRVFLPAEETPGQDQVVILSDGFWRDTFGSDPAILGRSLVLDGEPYSVVGVMPPGFRFPDDQEIALWVPLSFAEHETTIRAQRMFSVIGRLGEGMSLDRAESELKTIAARLAAQYPESNDGWSVSLTPARDVFVGSQRPLVILLVAVSLVLAIACVNLVNLLIARGADRRKEIAVRVALGAGKWDIIRQMVLESLILGVLGGAAGLVLATWGMELFVALDPGSIPSWNAVTLDFRVMLFAAAAAIGSSLVAGLLPARQVIKTDLNTSLKETGSVSAGPGRQRMRQALVITEVALAFILVAGAGLLIHSLYRLQRVDPGFHSDQLVITGVSLATTRYPEDGDQHRFFQRLLDRLTAHPDVAAAAVVTTLPMNPVGIDHDMEFVVAGATPRATAPQADFRITSAGYFQLMGIPIVQGREFTGQDRDDAPRGMVVNETMARLAFPDGPVLGRKVTTGGYQFEVIGVAADVRHRGLDVAPRPEMFVHEPQIYSYGNMNVVARSRGDLAKTALAIKQAVHAIDPDQPLAAITTMPELLSDSVSRRWFVLLLLSVFAGVGLLLAAIGIYGIISYTVGQRTREIGIRAALGASRSSLLRLVLGSGLRLALIGAVIGMAGAVGLTRLLRSQLYEVSTLDPLSLLLTAVLIMVVALAASLVPARRTLRVDPLSALRHE